MYRIKVPANMINLQRKEYSGLINNALNKCISVLNNKGIRYDKKDKEQSYKSLHNCIDLLISSGEDQTSISNICSFHNKTLEYVYIESKFDIYK